MNKVTLSKLNQIYLGDNVALMKQLPDNLVDLIFADPPYNMNLQKPLFRPNGAKFSGVDDQWDKYDSLVQYDTEAKIWLQECLRILKPHGSLWVIGSFQNIHRLGYILQDLGAWIINEIVWEKTNPVPNFAGTRFVNAQETMLWVVKNKQAKFTFNYKTMKALNKGKQMKSVWQFNSCTGNERLKDLNGKKLHSTQKPLALLERIILATSKYGDLVFDPFLGTGTTAHAAKKWGRQYLGFEIDLNYYQAAQNRLNAVRETNENDDLKYANFDKPLKKILFQDLLKQGIISSKDALIIDKKTFYFNEDGTITFENKNLSPNQLCRFLFKKPINAWNAIYVKGSKIGDLREEMRKNLDKFNS